MMLSVGGSREGGRKSEECKRGWRKRVRKESEVIFIFSSDPKLFHEILAKGNGTQLENI